MLGNDRCNENNTGTQRTLGKKPVLFFFSSSENVTMAVPDLLLLSDAKEREVLYPSSVVRHKLENFIIMVLLYFFIKLFFSDEKKFP